jgi:tRNA-specific 2-thiouridylase
MKRSSRAIAVAMSGGVDSSVAAALLKERGHEVMGITAVMTHGYSRCCSDEDVRAAARVAARIGIDHYVIDVKDRFKEDVIDYFVSEYLSARTPSPCAVCNRRIKFGLLRQKAFDLDADLFATGHYARVTQKPDGTAGLSRAADRTKDQSYFLARLLPEQLSRSVFPLGHMLKTDVSAYAREHGLVTRHSRESQELCFVDSHNHGAWIDVRCLRTPGQGDIVDTQGVRLGAHRGIHHYTIGQRKGLGLATGDPVYVVALDAGRNLVVVGSRSEAMSSDLVADAINWIVPEVPPAELLAQTQIRHNHGAARSRIAVSGATAQVHFQDPQFAVTPGQLAVFYRQDEVVGSGWIKARANPSLPCAD